MNALEMKNVCKKYPGFCLDHVNLDVPSGCIVGLIGENGAGKSTLIKAILGLVHADEGEIKVLGKDVEEVKSQLGVVLDTPGLPSLLNARQISFVLSSLYPNWRQDQYESCLAKMRADSSKAFHALSNGNKMKIAIAAALSHDAKLLLLDEATNGLDPVARDEVNEVLLNFARDENHAILISSHIVSDLEKLCDYIAFLHKGRLMLCEEKDVLLGEYCIYRCGAEALRALDPAAVVGKKESPYGVTAIVRREEVPAGLAPEPVSIEDLFILMVKEGEQ